MKKYQQPIWNTLHIIFSLGVFSTGPDGFPSLLPDPGGLFGGDYSPGPLFWSGDYLS